MMYPFSRRILETRDQALQKARQLFFAIEEISQKNTFKLLECFRKHKVGDHHFRTTSGYAYNDAGREKLEAVWADVFGAEKALVRTQFVSGTHALSTVLFGILRPGDELLAVTGAPYDTMRSVIGYANPGRGSLKEFGVAYKELPMVNQTIDWDKLKAAVSPNTKMALIQRSRGYSMRQPLSIADIEKACAAIKAVNPDCVCFVDNCYGEFVDTLEPTAAGADITAGSLIKNAGGGIAPTGGYIAGREELVELAAFRLTAPGIGSEVGASLIDNRLLFQGLFMAPHITAQALKGAVFAAAFFSLLGYHTLPAPAERRGDIIQAIELGSAEKMVAFCRGLQKYSPVDAHVRPEPSTMPGYADPVIMAAGTFIQGASIELSADGPLRPPFAVYLQGALSFEHAVVGIMGAAEEMEKLGTK
ncbi:Cystathionine beta-lyase family protein involved in aluminum resistance [Dendrosporobacter quercicolus]|uniref:Cystathionine beta-lyase family protein involved in aluminum resistance n=2 Tax=Dendrosporobacter quercicolus TaxID=146817 RepID=A0A1G9LT95_9FIRM|nr:Cystathionine beta-lyase family protein involved in aluminum resistance [Dendrosporobacter quercicolus]